MKTCKNLFKPLKIGTMEVKNRLVMCAMGTNYADPVTNFPTERMAKYYGERAKGGVGLIIVEHTMIEQRGLWSPSAAGIWSDDSIPAWKMVVDEVQQHGSKIVLQIGHIGSVTNSSLNKGLQPIAPSAIMNPGSNELPHELTLEEIETFKKKYVEACQRAKEAGFNGIEIHCTHGYLLAQFLSGKSNKRTDKYGGTLEGRMRLILELIPMIRRAVGRDYPLMARFAAHEENRGRSLEESKVIARAIVEAGLDALDVSSGSSVDVDWSQASHYRTPAFNICNIEKIKQSVNVPVIGSGRITEPRLAEQLIAEGRVDMVGINKAVIADPFWVKKAGSGDFDSIRRCIGCMRCIDGLYSSSDPSLKCAVNPLVGREGTITVGLSLEKKDILVIGGGPSGLQTAIVAAERGHNVTLVEREANLGGQIRVGINPPQKHELGSIIFWLKREAEKNKVKIIRGKEADLRLVRELNPQAIVIATGAKPLIPPIKGVENAITAIDALAGKPTGLKVAIIGAGITGCETAEFLAEYGKSVTIIEMTDKIASDATIVTRPHLLASLKKSNVDIKTNTRVTEIKADTLICQTFNQEIEIKRFDTIILALGMIPDNHLAKDLADFGKPVYPTGDALNAGKILEAIRGGFDIGTTL